MKLLILSIPFFSGFSLFTLGRFIGKKGAIFLSILSIFISQLLSINVLLDFLKYNTVTIINIGEWFNIGILKTSLEFIFDKESIIMINLISIISFVVISYSVWYMNDDPHITRFLSKLLIFTVTMFILVTSNNFLLLFAGWETVGIMSYLLINFWYNSLNSNKSAFKAILYNKIGDIGYLIGLTILINLYNNSNIKNLLINNTSENHFFIINLFLFFFILAAIAKSAQIFLHCWLGDAMAGPTPVSALLHAATMVTAGVFLLIRFSNNFFFEISHFNLYFILIIGALTILFGGFSSFSQFDIKKLIAFSTCSQIGYMFINNGFFTNSNNSLFFSTGLGDSSLFHLFTHGFFKALLFLSAGILIHNFNNDQDIRKYGSFIFKFPLTYLFFLIGSLSITSFPFLSGFFSKENIINNSFSSFNPLFIGIFLILGAFLTNLYSFKLFFSSFLLPVNSPKSTFFNNSGELPFIYLPLFLLLLFGSTFLGFFASEFFIAPGLSPFGIDHELFPGHLIVKLIPLFIILFVIFFNIFFSFNAFSFPLSFYFFSFFNRRAFFDPIFNYILAYPTFLASYSSFKISDRGFLELFGPLGLFRFFFFFYNSFNLKSQSLSNINFLFFYFFISLFSILFFFF
jgi:proton-translocating NADH-quinone oxidoreductase chain L